MIILCLSGGRVYAIGVLLIQANDRANDHSIPATSGLAVECPLRTYRMSTLLQSVLQLTGVYPWLHRQTEHVTFLKVWASMQVL